MRASNAAKSWNYKQKKNTREYKVFGNFFNNSAKVNPDRKKKKISDEAVYSKLKHKES